MTLQNRITLLMVISSILFISAFTTIQLFNQTQNINRFNSYRANMASKIVKDYLEAALKQSPANEAQSYIQSNLKELKDTNIVEDSIVYDEEGSIIAATESALIGETARYKDISKAEQLKYLNKEDRWFLPEIDNYRKQLDIFLILKKGPQEQLSYVAKISFPLANIQQALLAVYGPVLLSIIIIILANIIFGYLLSKTVIGPIKMLNNVTKTIAGGDLTVRTHIDTNDELEELGETFNHMTVELIKMKDRAENANPLTKLPGNIVIHEEVTKRIKNNQQFMVIYCDLDNFKAFNDKYGIAKGDEAIKLTADVFKEAAKLKGDAGDFIGHEGGDDFILLTTPEKAQGVADHITSEFDKRVRALYSDEDLKQGFIIAHARDGSVKQFPIMTISLAGVTNAHRVITSYGEVTNIAAEVKKKAKAVEGSVFVIDIRKESRPM
ncbi:MAG: diguanylate cyclase [Candidatus Omnitrophica bacterium]|nr:diguanylate cyclase [Candidatus Omnitrophota bacterium]